MVNTAALESFLNDKTAKENDICEIIGEGNIEEKDTQYGKRKILNLPVKLNGNSLTWSPGKIAVKECEKIFLSTDTKNWVNKKFSIGFVKMTVKGEIKNIVIPKKL